jgi:class 3 adenylate cyclase
VITRPQVKYARSGDVRIAYQVIGSGPIDLVFVPGFAWHLEVLWEEPGVRRFFERLASFCRMVLFDKREQGLSDRIGKPPTLEDTMDDIQAVMDAAGMERAALFGISEGGPASILFAATYPDRTSALCLYGSFARLLVADDYEQGIPEEVVDGTTQVIDEDWGGPVAIDLFAPTRAEDPAFRDWWARFLRAGSSPRGAVALLRLYKEIDVRHTLDAIAVPTLVMHREHDIAVPLDLGRYIADGIPGARWVVFGGADHIPASGNSDEIIDEVEEFLTGSRAHHEVDRVLATVMFTDIVGSTERAAALGDRGWRDLVARHDALTRREIERHRGRAIKTLGDGFLATFDGPARGIRCARSIVDQVRSLGIEVRAGLHTGECELVEDDVAGMAVNIGARVGALADAGEVLVSSTVRDLVVGSGVDFADRGEHALKGVPGAWRLFAVDRA